MDREEVFDRHGDDVDPARSREVFLNMKYFWRMRMSWKEDDSYKKTIVKEGEKCKIN